MKFVATVIAMGAVLLLAACGAGTEGDTEATATPNSPNVSSLRKEAFVANP